MAKEERYSLSVAYGRQLLAAATGCMVPCLREPRFEVWTARSDHLAVGCPPGVVV